MLFREIKNFVISIMMPFKWHLIGLIIINILWAIDLSLRPYILKIILDKVSVISADQALSQLAIPSFFYVGMGLGMSLIFRVYGYIQMKLNPILRAHVTEKLVERMMLQSHSFYQANFTGSLSNKIKDVSSGLPELIRMIIHDFLAYFCAIIIAITTIWQIDYRLSISLGIWTVIYCSVSILSAEKGKKLSDEAAEVGSSLTGHVIDLLSNIVSVRFFVKRGFEKKFLETKSTKYVEAQQKRDWYFLKLTSIQSFSFVIYQAFSIFYLINGFGQSRITPGDFGLVLTLNISMIDCLWMLSNDIIKFTETTGNVTQGLRTSLCSIDIKDEEDAANLIVNKGSIEYRNVSFGYPGSGLIFENLNIKINSGEKVGLVGYSGGGKSSFISLLLRLYNINSGEILIDGQDISKVTQDSLRDSIGVIPQDLSLFHRSLYDNLAYGQDSPSDKDIEFASQIAHIDEFVQNLPEGYKTIVGERGTKLSGGQRQRIIIARAILKNAPILILDEATSQLDSVTETNIQHSLKKLIEGKTSLVIAHRLSTLLDMDRILVFEKGRIVEQGNHHDLLALNGLYRKLWETQYRGFINNDKIYTAEEEL